MISEILFRKVVECHFPEVNRCLSAHSFEGITLFITYDFEEMMLFTTYDFDE